MQIKKFYKVLLLIKIFLLSQISVAQKITFDKKITYQKSFLDKQYQETILVNSSDQSKILEIRQNIQGNYAFLYDLKTMFKHKFELKVTDNNPEFAYSYSEKIDYSREHYYYYDFKLLSNDSLNIYGEFYRYKSKKKKKKNRVDELKIRKNENNFFFVYYFLNKIDGEQRRIFNLNIKGIVEKATYFSEEVIVNVELIEFENINFQITVPKEINLKNFKLF